MLKPVIAATALLAIAGSSLVYAQQGYGGYRGFRDGGGWRMQQHRRLSVDDVSALADARIAALKAGLELTPDQAKAWPAFEAALRNMVQLRIERIKARQAAQQQDQSPTAQSPFDRLAKRADAMSKRSTALKQIADAGQPLYASLNDAQKARFTMLARMLRPHHHGFNGGERREGRNFDRDGRDGGQGGWGHRRFGENGPGFGQRDQDGQGDGPGWRHGRMHNLSNDDSDQGSQL
jgi:LTXXQ motif family protein